MITNRNLEEGTKLVATYKGKTRTCEVSRDADRRPVYILDDGQEFKSPSSAGKAVMGGIACNGWRFWSVADGAVFGAKGKAAKKAQPKAAKKAAKGRRRKRGDNPGFTDVKPYSCARCGKEYGTIEEAADCCPPVEAQEAEPES